MTDDTQNNEPASPIGEGDSVTRNVMPMALHRVREFARKERGIAMRQADCHEEAHRYNDRNIARQYALAMHKVACFVAREIDAIETQHETRSRSSEPSA